MLGLLILVHELGHFITGRMLGFKINEFAIGMGPKIFSWKRKEIVYSIRAIPLGGFVAFHGEDGEEENDPRAMNNMPWYKRAVVMFSGAGFNILFALIVTAILTVSVGYYAPAIHSVNEKTGLYNVAQPGDLIYAINDNVLADPSEFQDEIAEIANDESIKFTVIRNGEIIEYSAVRYYDDTEKRHIIGITHSYGLIEPNIFESIGHSARYNLWMTKVTYKSLWELITGEMSLDNLTGPISTIGQIGGLVEETANVGQEHQLSFKEQLAQIVITITQLLVIISMNLAVMNLLPIPALDGFRLLFTLIEGITKKHIPRKIEGAINAIGLICLIGLMVVLEVSKLFTG